MSETLFSGVVPDLSGMTYEEAVAHADAHGFKAFIAIPPAPSRRHRLLAFIRRVRKRLVP